MIKISAKEQCCGCSACLHICPKHCILFKEDKEGFLYPTVDDSLCIDCGLCEKVCPVINQDEERLPLKVYAAKHPDESIRLKSSSGGIFTFLAEQVIDEGGVVFGARFNEKWEVIHDYAETKDGLAPFRGSKYVQSFIGDSYKQVEMFLKAGRKVMFTGTPCQIAGLKKYLRREYDNLLTVDFVCHGVPSPKVWRMYLQEEITRHRRVDENTILTGINFRDKSTGWSKFSFVLSFSTVSTEEKRDIIMSSVFTENDYMEVFLSNLSLRPSCFSCPAKSGKSGADVTIGDFWGIETSLPEYDDNGISLILVNKDVIELPVVGKYIMPQTFSQALRKNTMINESVQLPLNRTVFMKMLNVLGFSNSFHLVTNSNPFCGLIRKLCRII